ncbi:2-dehydro-3-deoxyphosphogalactonate aldolase [Caenispirillum salinarum AK4]|uniref:2-dehydro-3-deoxyphosphogalactonate aldolase n=1 Tax=Caenispirillum salinarum AK4 TaxID=1238182 RepID=K9GTU7_9PROT|nr:2-dehydro-3-deoxy-6-phosphogalactonate aldolase [Caenispirillum salinarum]EKV28587.1 2-dehydro-3-deoxyphosphogalactonate aldolase [Caenispirillum salinarum AK4]
MTDAFDTAFDGMPLVAVLRHITTDEIIPVADALVDAGFRFLEVPLNSPDAFTSIGKLAKHCPPHVLTGAGTVLEPSQVRRLADTGAKLMVTPNTDADVIDAAVSAGLYPLIGCLTPTEALQAVRRGARGLKIFPASRMGPDYLKDIRAVLPQGTRLLPVGGIGLETMEAFHRTGADGFGYGTNLYKPGRPAADVGETARALVTEFRRLRGR